MADLSFLAWPFLEDRHRDLHRQVAGFAASVVPGLVDHHDVDGSCRRLVAALGEAGIGAHAVTAPHGGLAPRHDVRALSIIRQTLAEADGLADFAFAMQGLGAGPVALFGREDQKARLLPEVAAGRLIPAFALTEPDAGSDVAALALSATPDGPDHYRLTGEKTWISNGGIAGIYVVFARTGEAPGARGLSAFVVEADTAGLAIAERLDTIAPHPLARLRLDGVRVPRTALIGKPGEGFKVAMATLDVFRTTVGAAAVGFARRAVDATTRRLTARRLFGAPMAELPLAQAGLADMVVDLDLATLAIYRAAWTRDSGAERITREASIAKLVATEAAQRVIDTAVQLHGGDGVRSGSTPEMLYREIRALRIYEGASEVQKLVIARQHLSGSGS